MFKKILVAYDGSPHSRRALQAALDLARGEGSSAHLLYAYDRIPSYLGEPNLQSVTDRIVASAREMVEHTLEQASVTGVPVTADILEGPPAEAVLRVAEAENFDLIVMGSRGLGQLQGLLMGSVSNRIMLHAKIPVLIIR